MPGVETTLVQLLKDAPLVTSLPTHAHEVFEWRARTEGRARRKMGSEAPDCHEPEPVGPPFDRARDSDPVARPVSWRRDVGSKGAVRACQRFEEQLRRGAELIGRRFDVKAVKPRPQRACVGRGDEPRHIRCCSRVLDPFKDGGRERRKLSVAANAIRVTPKAARHLERVGACQQPMERACPQAPRGRLWKGAHDYCDIRQRFLHLRSAPHVWGEERSLVGR